MVRSALSRMGGKLESVAGLQAAAPVGRGALLGRGDESCSGDTENHRDLQPNLWYAAESLQTARILVVSAAARHGSAAAVLDL